MFENFFTAYWLAFGLKKQNKTKTASLSHQHRGAEWVCQQAFW